VGARNPCSWKAFWLVCALALLVRVLVFAVNVHRDAPVILQQDSWGYIEPGDSLSRGRGYTDMEGRVLSRWPPGYACFLGLIFATGLASPSSLGGAVAAQIVLSALVGGAAFLVAGWLGGARPAIAAGILMAIEPSSVAYSNFIMSETLYTAGLLGAILLWRLWWKRAGTGSLMLLAAWVGVLPLIRPVAVYLPFLLALLIGLSGAGGRPRPRAALIFLAVSLLAPVAWSARNFRMIGVPVLARVGEFEMARFSHLVEKMDGQETRLPSPKGPWEEGFQEEGGYTNAEVARARSRYFLKTATGHPVAMVRLLVANGLRLLGVPDSKLPQILMSAAPTYEGGSIRERLEWLRRLGILGVLLAVGMIVSVGGVASMTVLAVRARTWPAERKWLLALLSATALLHVMFSSTVMWQAERYRVPVIPLLCALLCAAVLGVRREIEPAQP
jgi:hypothetical protein